MNFCSRTHKAEFGTEDEFYALTVLLHLAIIAADHALIAGKPFIIIAFSQSQRPKVVKIGIPEMNTTVDRYKLYYDEIYCNFAR